MTQENLKDRVKTIRKKVQATIETTQPKTTWQKIKDWFYNSENVAYNYGVAAIGAITSVIGYMDWSPLWRLFQTGTAFTQRELLFVGIAVVGAGVGGYFTRVMGTKEVDGHLLPKAG